MGTIVELSLTGMAHGGEALGRYEGRVIFVAGCIHGERVRVEITEDHKRWSRGRLLEVLEPSPHRVEPRCPHFGVCGGCHWQHISYAAQVQFKREILRGQLARLGRVQDPPVAQVLVSPEPWTYRNHLQLSAAGPGAELGFLDASGSRVTPIKTCLLPHPLVWGMAETLEIGGLEEEMFLRRLSLRAGIRTGERMMVFETQDDLPPGIEADLPISCVLLMSDGNPVNLVGNNWLTEELGGRRFRISAGSFFQVNTAQADRLLEVVGQFLDPKGEEVLLDLYCGVGTFALSLADRAQRVIGIESYGPAIADARANALAGEPVEFIEGPAVKALAGLRCSPQTVIVDPPRTGCSREVLKQLLRLSPSRLIYVSCDPATLARDTRQLREAGYALNAVQPIDMFPQTFHLESVSLFTR
jgi:23S rRNA (uracil1939-C5)-methyltransferase